MFTISGTGVFARVAIARTAASFMASRTPQPFPRRLLLETL
jgi:hypothetical protein